MLTAVGLVLGQTAGIRNPQVLPLVSGYFLPPRAGFRERWDPGRGQQGHILGESGVSM